MGFHIDRSLLSCCHKTSDMSQAQEKDQSDTIVHGMLDNGPFGHRKSDIGVQSSQRQAGAMILQVNWSWHNAEGGGDSLVK